MDDEAAHDAPTDPNLLTAPSVLSPDSLAVADLSSREASNGSSAAEGEGVVEPVGEKKLSACGDCPACRALGYIESHGDVVTEVVDCGEGVYLGPDDSYFPTPKFQVVMGWKKGIGVIAIDTTDPQGVAWWEEQQEIVIRQELIQQLFGGIIP